MHSWMFFLFELNSKLKKTKPRKEEKREVAVMMGGCVMRQKTKKKSSKISWIRYLGHGIQKGMKEQHADSQELCCDFECHLSKLSLLEVEALVWMNFDVLLLFLSCLLGTLECCSSIISINLDSKHGSNDHAALKAIKYCKGCPSAEVQGSLGITQCD